MSDLSEKSFRMLINRGFDLVTSYQRSITLEINTLSLAWLLNYINTCGGYGKTVSLSMLRNISSAIISKDDWRDLRIKCLPVDVYDNDLYYQYVFYLNASPPKFFFSFYPDKSSVEEALELPHIDSMPFKLNDESMVTINFTEEQVNILKSGSTLVEMRQDSLDT